MELLLCLDPSSQLDSALDDISSVMLKMCRDYAAWLNMSVYSGYTQ